MLAGIPKSLDVPSFYPRSQQGDFDRVKIHVLVIDVFEAVPGAVRTQRPAFSRIDMIRLPYIKNQPSDSVSDV